MGFWPLAWSTLENGRGQFYSGWWRYGPPGPGVGIPVAATCMAATIWASRAALAGMGPGGPGGPAGPTGPAGPGMGSGGGGGDIVPPPAPSLGGGMGAATSKTQCNNELNPTLVVDNWSMS